MRRRALPALLTLLVGCSSVSGPVDVRTRKAEAFIDAFYSFDRARLEAALGAADDASKRKILYYQGWAEGGHYQVVKRQPCRVRTESDVSCSITVKDDLIKALRGSYDVTDTFHLRFSGDDIVSVNTSSDDPPVMNEALAWVRSEKMAQIETPCRDFFDGGPTPQECVRTVVRLFGEYVAQKK